MLFNFFIFLVFIAEIIITITIISFLLKLDKSLIEYNNFVEEIKPNVKDIMQTIRKISVQFVELATISVKNIKLTVKNILISQLKNVLGGLTFYLVKKEVEKHVR